MFGMPQQILQERHLRFVQYTKLTRRSFMPSYITCSRALFYLGNTVIFAACLMGSESEQGTQENASACSNHLSRDCQSLSLPHLCIHSSVPASSQNWLNVHSKINIRRANLTNISITVRTTGQILQVRTTDFAESPQSSVSLNHSQCNHKLGQRSHDWALKENAPMWG